MFHRNLRSNIKMRLLKSLATSTTPKISNYGTSDLRIKNNAIFLTCLAFTLERIVSMDSLMLTTLALTMLAPRPDIFSICVEVLLAGARVCNDYVLKVPRRRSV